MNTMMQKALQRHFDLDNKAEDINKRNFCSYMEEQNELGSLQIVSLPNKVIYRLYNNIIDVSLDASIGLYLYTEAGHNKSNKRQYLNINGWMCPAYVFRVVFEGLTSKIPQHIERYKKYENGIYEYRELTKKEKIYDNCDVKSRIYAPTFNRSVINHKNGDTMDNSDTNLEVVSYNDNNIHSRFMSEVYYYHPELISVSYDCQGHAMHQWTDKVGISCTDINTWNSNHNNKITAFKDKKGEFKSRFTKEEVDEMLKFFGKLQKEKQVIKHNKHDDIYVGYDF